MVTNTHIQGLDSALRKLKEIDPKLEREAKKRLKNDVKVIVQEARNSIPSSPPLSRWVSPKGAAADSNGIVRSGKSRLPVWDSGRARRRIGASVTRKRVRGYTGRRLLISVRQGDAAGAAYDMAGRASSNVFASNLSSRHGSASRGMWPAAEKHMNAVHDSIKESVREVERQINRELRTRV